MALMIRLSDNRDASWRSAPRTRLVEGRVERFVLQVDGDGRRAGVSHKAVKPADRAQAHKAWEKDTKASGTGVMYSAIRKDYQLRSAPVCGANQAWRGAGWDVPGKSKRDTHQCLYTDTSGLWNHTTRSTSRLAAVSWSQPW